MKGVVAASAVAVVAGAVTSVVVSILDNELQCLSAEEDQVIRKGGLNVVSMTIKTFCEYCLNFKTDYRPTEKSD